MLSWYLCKYTLQFRRLLNYEESSITEQINCYFRSLYRVLFISITFLFHILRMVQWYADQPGQSTVEYATDVWLDLITIVDGWYLHLLLDAWWYWFYLVCVLTPEFSVLIQNNCIGEKNTRYFVAFLVWWVLIFLPLFHVSIYFWLHR
jgi:hypothetical protein